MATRHWKQRDFSGGEISPRMLMRADTDVYQKSLLEMENYQPTIQGTARKMPGTRFVRDVGNPDARIIPYLTTANERSLLLLTPLAAKLLTNVTDGLGPAQFGATTVSTTTNGPTTQATVIYKEPLIEDDTFQKSPEDVWTFSPRYGDDQSVKPKDPGIGIYWGRRDKVILMVPRVYKSAQEPNIVSFEQALDISYPTSVAKIAFSGYYISNPPINDGEYQLTVEVSDQPDYSNELFKRTWTNDQFPVGSNYSIEYDNIPLPGAPFTGTVYVRVSLEAIKGVEAEEERKYSNPQIAVSRLQVWADNEVELTETDLVTPYAAEDLADVQYVQSPYGDPDGFKEMVFTHPKHPPQRFYFSPTLPGYVFEAIPFTNTPGAWAINNYPAACTSYHGRLVLAGGQTFKVAAGDPVASVSETVWATEVGKWDTFSDTTDVNPDDSIEFTAVYRSPIQWVFGGKSLLVGSLEYEYSASGEGIFSPGDLGVFLHTTHGSNNVQPSPFGDQVIFPADAGTKVRSFTYSNQDQSWIAADLTILNPEICFPKIVRMARVRNPHQQCWVLSNNGTVAIYNAESGMQGWNNYNLSGGYIKDICVQTDADGRDVPMLLVTRDINGSKVNYLEAIPNFTDTERWDYTGSTKTYAFDTPTDTITGLEHLENMNVQVYDQYRFVGTYIVEGGQVVLEDQAGGTTTMNVAIVGLIHEAKMKTLPPVKDDPGGAFNFVDVSVRILGGAMPLINGERPAERRPGDVMNLSPPPDFDRPDIVRDGEIYTGGWTMQAAPIRAAIIEIQERVPFPSQILGVFGKVQENSV